LHKIGWRDKKISISLSDFVQSDPILAVHVNRGLVIFTLEWKEWNSTFFTILMIIKGTTEKVLQFILPLRIKNTQANTLFTTLAKFFGEIASNSSSLSLFGRCDTKKIIAQGCLLP
jgi:hypothetical protein